ncbi:MAG: sigma-70 family RNA polymerase sigma factor [Rickettsiales bacterium]
MTEATTTPEALMRLSLAGDSRAYGQLLAEAARMLRPFLARRMQRADVEDVLQEILLSIHKARHTYDGQRPFKPWLFAIARFRLSDHWRAHYGDELAGAAELSEAEFVAAQDVTESPLTYEDIKGEIDRLPGKQPTILTLLHRDGFTSKEVAAKLGMKESAVKVAAHRAYKVLRKRLSA